MLSAREKSFLYEIVANGRTEIDVDKYASYSILSWNCYYFFTSSSVGKSDKIVICLQDYIVHDTRPCGWFGLQLSF